MALKLNKLSARTVATLSKSGRHADGGGLYLTISGSAKSWVYLWMKDGKRREMGLGSLSSVGLADARRKAADCRRMVAEGVDPLEARGAVVRAVPTFGEVAEALIAVKSIECRSPNTSGNTAPHSKPMLGRSGRCPSIRSRRQEYWGFSSRFGCGRRRRGVA